MLLRDNTWEAAAAYAADAAVKAPPAGAGTSVASSRTSKAAVHALSAGGAKW